MTLGRWSQMRRTYLKEHHKILYYNLLTKGILNNHGGGSAESERTGGNSGEADGRESGLTEQMKAEDMMRWVR